MIFVDSNIWCYYFDQRQPEHEQVLEPMRKIIKSEEIICNTIILMEVAHYLVRHFKEEVARRKIDFFTNLINLKIIDFNREAMAKAIEALLEHAYADDLGGRDATVLATMKSQNVTKIFSHDSIFKSLAKKLELEVIDTILTPK